MGRISERVTIASEELVDYVKRLVEKGAVRRLIISKSNGELLLDVPLIAGIATSGAIVLIVPLVAALGAIAALVTKVQVDIVRTDGDEDS